MRSSSNEIDCLALPIGQIFDWHWWCWCLSHEECRLVVSNELLSTLKLALERKCNVEFYCSRWFLLQHFADFADVSAVRKFNADRTYSSSTSWAMVLKAPLPCLLALPLPRKLVWRLLFSQNDPCECLDCDCLPRTSSKRTGFLYASEFLPSLLVLRVTNPCISCETFRVFSSCTSSHALDRMWHLLATADQLLTTLFISLYCWYNHSWSSFSFSIFCKYYLA